MRNDIKLFDETVQATLRGGIINGITYQKFI